jgi:hypothetical protein
MAIQFLATTSRGSAGFYNLQSIDFRASESLDIRKSRCILIIVKVYGKGLSK